MTYKPTYPVLVVTKTTTAQQVFEAVVDHLEKQGKPCVKTHQPDESVSNYCTNRNNEGGACAAACLLTNEESVNGSFNELMMNNIVPARLIEFSGLILELQGAHDKAKRVGALVRGDRTINEGLAEVAKAHGLTFSKPITTWDFV